MSHVRPVQLLSLDQQDAAYRSICHVVLRERARLESWGITVVRCDDQVGKGIYLAPPAALLGSGVIGWVKFCRPDGCISACGGIPFAVQKRIELFV